jgi:hypothetical protein
MKRVARVDRALRSPEHMKRVARVDRALRSHEHLEQPTHEWNRPHGPRYKGECEC